MGVGGDVWTVTKVVDGDTIDVANETDEATVRLIGINAPEVGECFYDQATTALRFIVGSRPVRLVRDQSDVDQYGRLLRYVELTEGVDVGRELVRAGFARSQRFEPDTSRSGEWESERTIGWTANRLSRSVMGTAPRLISASFPSLAPSPTQTATGA